MRASATTRDTGEAHGCPALPSRHRQQRWQGARPRTDHYDTTVDDRGGDHHRHRRGRAVCRLAPDRRHRPGCPLDGSPLMIQATGLSKRYGATLAVDDLSFTVPPGQVTGFLGPNGAGKSTTMRLILGLDAPSSGSVTVSGRPFAKAAYPMREVGALLDAKAIHGGRSAHNHLLCLAQTNNLPASRVGEVLDLVGLREVAKKR